MLTDSGVNAMSDKQLAAMMESDDSYAGSASYTKLENEIKEIFGTEYFLPAHQGRLAKYYFSSICKAWNYCTYELSFYYN